jgi:hypothetical protein
MVRAERFPRRGGSTLTGSFIELSTGPPTPQREESHRHHDRDHSRVGISCLSAVDLAEVLTDRPDGKQEPEPATALTVTAFREKATTSISASTAATTAATPR